MLQGGTTGCITLVGGAVLGVTAVIGSLITLFIAGLAHIVATDLGILLIVAGGCIVGTWAFSLLLLRLYATLFPRMRTLLIAGLVADVLARAKRQDKREVGLYVFREEIAAAAKVMDDLLDQQRRAVQGADSDHTRED
jgi:hypothetical protein